MSPASHGTFIAVEVEDSVRGDVELAKRLEEACPVDIFAAAEDGVHVVQENLDECVLCGLCLDASGHALYVADRDNHKVKRIALTQAAAAAPPAAAPPRAAPPAPAPVPVVRLTRVAGQLQPLQLREVRLEAGRSSAGAMARVGTLLLAAGLPSAALDLGSLGRVALGGAGGVGRPRRGFRSSRAEHPGEGSPARSPRHAWGCATSKRRWRLR